MATYLYCITSDPRQVPDALTGVDGTPVRSIRADGLTAWVSEVADASPRPTVDRVKAHDAVCANALATGETPLPIRFGQTFASDPAAVNAIVARRQTLVERLSRIAGCVELRVIVSRGRDVPAVPDVAAGLREEASAEPVARGTAFLRRLAQEGRADLAREVTCEELRHSVRRSATDFIVEQQRCEAARGVSFFPLLVRRDELEECRVAIAAGLPADGVGVSVLGPFPPYSFAGDV